MVAIARAFSHRLCIRLVDELASGEATVSDLSVRLREPQPSISSHLALLRKCGLVDVEPRGRQRAYRLRGRAPALAVATLRTLAAAAGGFAASAGAANLVTDRASAELKWDKAACRFCGTGCSVMVATKEGRVVATHGDAKSEVNAFLEALKALAASAGAQQQQQQQSQGEQSNGKP